MDLIKSLETAKLQITKTCTRIITSGTRHKYRKYGQNKEQVMGIEPTCPAWKAGVLPLNYTCIY